MFKFMDRIVIICAVQSEITNNYGSHYTNNDHFKPATRWKFADFHNSTEKNSFTDNAIIINYK